MDEAGRRYAADTDDAAYATLMFIRHVVEDALFALNLIEGAKGVQLAELGLRSWAERRWLDVPKLEV